MKKRALLILLLLVFFLSFAAGLPATAIECDIAWYRGGGAASGAWSSNIQKAFEELERDEGITWEIISTAQDIRDGVLQNPDGSPRYRVIYFMGGSGRDYNSALGQEGAHKVRDFVTSGGGYVGTCAGAFYGSANYTGLFPGDMNWNNVSIKVTYNLYTAHEINNGFGPKVENVQFAGGGWLDEGLPEVDYVATYSNANSYLNGHPAVTVNKYGGGRVVLSGAHPEASLSTLSYFKRLIIYTLDGQTQPSIPLPPTGLRIIP